MDPVLIIPILASLLVGLLVMPSWIRKAKEIGLIWQDMNKLNAGTVAGSGGIIAVLGFIIGVLIFIAYKTFYLKSTSELIEIFALLSVVTMLAGVGLIDDLLGWRRGGLSIKSRIIIVLIAAIPIVVINAGKSTMSVPFFGNIEFGLVYPLALVPIGILGASTTFNFLAGFNGLEAGQGVLLLSALGIAALFTGSPWLAVIALCMIASLLAFLLYNFCPAKIFPGDSLTLAVGGLIAIIAILGNFEKIAVFFFIPYIIEVALKVRGKLKKYSFGKPMADGSLDLRYSKLYGLEHVSIWLLKKLNIKATERRVVFSIWAFQILVIAVGFLLFKNGIFK